ncbi:MAG: hypothetical protein D6E12_13170 [Desulfovibrio sp.]|nr:MAG: hypothetical protein D6E12_13170 [Desulfovibrio sp.]
MKSSGLLGRHGAAFPVDYGLEKASVQLMWEKSQSIVGKCNSQMESRAQLWRGVWVSTGS